MKVKELFSKVFKTKRRTIAFGIIVLVIIALCVFPFIYNGKATVDTESLNTLLSKSSELTSAKLTITAMSEFKDTGLPILNKANFTMVYDATVRAGINIDEVKIESNNVDTIYISIPKAQIQEAKVDASSIKYFDEKLALFNVNEKEDANKAIALAEEDAMKEAAKTGLLEMADTQSEALIKGILANAIPDGYKMEIKQN